MDMVLRDKPALFVSVGIGEEGRQKGSQAFQDRFERMLKLDVLGHIYYRSRIPPCLKCGLGHACRKGGLWYLVGRDEQALKDFEITPDTFHRYEEDAETMERVRAYGSLLSEL